MRKVLIHAVGWTFILIGIAGLVLPVLQGFLFIIVGLLILSKELPWADRLIQKLKAKSPKFGGMIDQARAYMESEIEKVRTQRGYFWRRLPMFFLAIVVLAGVSIGLSIFFVWVKDWIAG